jgi:hypothetical protein
VAGTDTVLQEEEVVVVTEQVVAVGPLVKEGVSNPKGDTARFLLREGGTERWE